MKYILYVIINIMLNLYTIIYMKFIFMSYFTDKQRNPVNIKNYPNLGHPKNGT
jgi:hypothetical protein